MTALLIAIPLIALIVIWLAYGAALLIGDCAEAERHGEL